MPITMPLAVSRVAGSRHITNAWQPCAGLAGPVRQVRTIITIIDCQDLRTSSGSFAIFTAIRRAPDVRFWHKADILVALSDVRFWRVKRKCRR